MDDHQKSTTSSCGSNDTVTITPGNDNHELDTFNDKDKADEDAPRRLVLVCEEIVDVDEEDLDDCLLVHIDTTGRKKKNGTDFNPSESVSPSSDVVMIESDDEELKEQIKKYQVEHGSMDTTEEMQVQKENGTDFNPSESVSSSCDVVLIDSDDDELKEQNKKKGQVEHGSVDTTEEMQLDMNAVAANLDESEKYLSQIHVSDNVSGKTRPSAGDCHEQIPVLDAQEDPDDNFSDDIISDVSDSEIDKLESDSVHSNNIVDLHIVRSVSHGTELSLPSLISKVSNIDTQLMPADPLTEESHEKQVIKQISPDLIPSKPDLTSSSIQNPLSHSLLSSYPIPSYGHGHSQPVNNQFQRDNQSLPVEQIQNVQMKHQIDNNDEQDLLSQTNSPGSGTHDFNEVALLKSPVQCIVDSRLSQNQGETMDTDIVPNVPNAHLEKLRSLTEVFQTVANRSIGSRITEQEANNHNGGEMSSLLADVPTDQSATVDSYTVPVTDSKCKTTHLSLGEENREEDKYFCKECDLACFGQFELMVHFIIDHKLNKSSTDDNEHVECPVCKNQYMLNRMNVHLRNSPCRFAIERKLQKQPTSSYSSTFSTTSISTFVKQDLSDDEYSHMLQENSPELEKVSQTVLKSKTESKANEHLDNLVTTKANILQPLDIIPNNCNSFTGTITSTKSSLSPTGMRNHLGVSDINDATQSLCVKCPKCHKWFESYLQLMKHQKQGEQCIQKKKDISGQKEDFHLLDIQHCDEPDGTHTYTSDTNVTQEHVLCKGYKVNFQNDYGLASHLANSTQCSVLLDKVITNREPEEYPCQSCGLLFDDDESLARHLQGNRKCVQPTFNSTLIPASSKTKLHSNINTSSNVSRDVTALPVFENAVKGIDDNLADKSTDYDSSSDYCDSSYSKSEGDIEYRCKKCSLTFSQKTTFKAHRQDCAKRLSCKVCKRSFENEIDLKAHLLDNKYCFRQVTQAYWKTKSCANKCCPMCKKTFLHKKEKRKHCFKNMACRLKYVEYFLEKRSEVSQTTDESQVSSSSSAVLDVIPLSDKNEYSEKEGHKSPLDIPGRAIIGKHFTCFFCSLEFSSETSLKRHINKSKVCKLNDRNKGYYCDICKRNFTGSRKYKTVNDFTKLHKCSNYKVRCPTCGMAWQSVFALKLHQRKFEPCGSNVKISNQPQENENEKHHKYTCMFCHQNFNVHHQFVEHSYSHTDEGHYQCDQCTMTFEHYNRLVSHIAVHERLDKETKKTLGLKDQQIRCLVHSCDMVFYDKKSYAEHITWHAMSPSPIKQAFSCSTCKKEFFTGKDLKKHMSVSIRCVIQDDSITSNTIPTEKNICKYCSRQFDRVIDLKKHMAISKCKRKVNCKKQLPEKTKPAALNKTSFKCMLCRNDREFKSSLKLQAHKERVHSRIGLKKTSARSKPFNTYTGQSSTDPNSDAVKSCEIEVSHVPMSGEFESKDVIDSPEVKIEVDGDSGPDTGGMYDGIETADDESTSSKPMSVNEMLHEAIVEMKTELGDVYSADTSAILDGDKKGEDDRLEQKIKVEFHELMVKCEPEESANLGFSKEIINDEQTMKKEIKTPHTVGSKPEDGLNATNMILLKSAEGQEKRHSNNFRKRTLSSSSADSETDVSKIKYQKVVSVCSQNPIEVVCIKPEIQDQEKNTIDRPNMFSLFNTQVDGSGDESDDSVTFIGFDNPTLASTNETSTSNSNFNGRSSETKKRKTSDRPNVLKELISETQSYLSKQK